MIGTRVKWFPFIKVEVNTHLIIIDPSRLRQSAANCWSILSLPMFAATSNQIIFFPHQHGFRKGFSCDTQLFELTTDLHFNMNENKQTDCVFIDFSKAFDRVAHCRLISKLSALRLDSLTLSWIRNFLSFLKQFTTVNNYASTPSDVISGVPQGSVLGPLLFLIYINDLPNNISSNIRLFADDCIIYRAINNDGDHLTLQTDLNLISDWCDVWQMSLNSSKCRAMTFSRKHKNSNYSYSIKNDTIVQCSSYKYLGVNLTPNLSWSAHISVICAKASKTLGYLRRNLRKSPTSIRKLAYFTYVRPQLEFASSVWSPFQDYLTTLLESIQNRAARFISRNYSTHCSVTTLKQEHSISPLHVRRSVALLCLLHKYIHSTRRSTLPLTAPLRMSRRLHNHLSFTRIYGKTKAFNLSALPKAISLWNDLPDCIASITDPDSFREHVCNHFSSH